MPTIRVAGGILVALMVAGCAGNPLGGETPAHGAGGECRS